eukprot:s1109_g6.t1
MQNTPDPTWLNTLLDVGPLKMLGPNPADVESQTIVGPAADDTAFTPDAQEAQPPQNPAAQPLRHPPPLGDTLLALQAQHKTAVEEARRKRVNTFLAEVDQTLRDGSQHVAYKTLKKLRPWQPARKAQLKDQQGNLLSPLDELQALKAYAEEVFACHPPLRFMDGALPPIPADLLAKHVGSIRPDKAVPEGAAPAAAWRQCSQSIGQALSTRRLYPPR